MATLSEKKDSNQVRERKTLSEIIEYIEREYNPESSIRELQFTLFKPNSKEWEEEFVVFKGQQNEGYRWGFTRNVANTIFLTQCEDTKAFYELVFHEIYEKMFIGGHEKVVPEERAYIEWKFDIKLRGNREWSPLEDEIVRILYPSQKERLENTLRNTGFIDRSREEIEKRAKELELC